MTDMFIRKEVVVQIDLGNKPGSQLLTLGQLRELLAAETITALTDDYEVVLEPQQGHWQVFRFQEATSRPAAITIDTNIEDLDLTIRTYNVLHREGVHTVGQIVERTVEQFEDMRNFGYRSIQELRDKLEPAGFVITDPRGPA